MAGRRAPPSALFFAPAGARLPSRSRLPASGPAELLSQMISSPAARRGIVMSQAGTRASTRPLSRARQLQGPLLRFEFVPQAPGSISDQCWPMTRAPGPMPAPPLTPCYLYPRFRPMGVRPTNCRHWHSTVIVTLNSPYITEKWISLSSATPGYRRAFRSLRTMPDPIHRIHSPIYRTASPYPDKNFQGPRSQQLLSAQVTPHSLLHGGKSKTPTITTVNTIPFFSPLFLLSWSFWSSS